MTLAIRATPQSKSLDKVYVCSEDLGRVSKDAGKGSTAFVAVITAAKEVIHQIELEKV